MSVRHSSARSSMVPPCHWWMRRRNSNVVRAGAAAPLGAGDQDADRQGRPVFHRKARRSADQAVDQGAPLQRHTRGQRRDAVCRTGQARRCQSILLHAARPPQLSRSGHHASHPRRAPAIRSDRRQAPGALTSAIALARSTDPARLRLSRSELQAAPRSLTRPHLQPVPPISQTASGSTAVLEYRPTETLPLLGAMLLGFARLCRRSRPARPPKRRKTCVFPGTEAKSGERRTVCWREMDSKIQFRDASPPPSARAFIRRPRPTTAQMIPPRRRSIGLNSAEASKPLLISYVTTPISCFFPTIAGARRHRGLSRPLAIEIDDTASPLAYA